MIEISVDAGSSEAARAVEALAIALNRVLDATTKSVVYSPLVDSYLIAWRVSGHIADFAFEGLDRLRLHRRKRTLTVDLGVTESRWKNVPPLELHEYLLEQTRQALQAFVDRLARDREQIDAARLFADYESAVEQVRRMEPLHARPPLWRSIS